jgi:site-specific DNA recombinase
MITSDKNTEREETDMENAYIYTRVSTVIQVDGFSLDAQEQEIRAFAQMRGINIVGKYSDEGKSGKNAEHRPAFNQMMDDIRSKKDNVRYVLVFKLSRFARNTSDTAKYLQELASYGVGLLGVKDGIDTSTVTGKMIANIMGAVAEVELENIHEQTLAGRQQKARSGLWNGAQAPYGYVLENKALTICPEEAEIVKEIFRLYTEEGQSIRYITKKLNDDDIKREQRGNTQFSLFTDRTVRSILKNPVYEGKIAYGRRHTVKVEGTNNDTKVVKQTDESKIILVDGLHEAIVTPDTFSKAQMLLSKNVAHRKTRSDSSTVYPLTGLIRCPDCGKNIFGYSAPPRPRKNGKEGFYPRYISYRCISGRDRNGVVCSLANKYYSGTKLEKEVKEVVSSMVTIPEFVELVSQKIDLQTDVNALRKKRSAIEAELSKYSGNLVQTERRLAELDAGDKHYDRKVDSLNRILDDLYEKMDDAQNRLDGVTSEIAMIEKSAMTKESIFEMLHGFREYYDVMSPEDKKTLLQAMISYIELYKEKRADGHLVKTIHFTFPVTYDGESGALFIRTNEQQVETVMSLVQQKPDDIVKVGIDADELAVTKAESKATYGEIQARVKEQTGLNVTPLYIAQVKRKHGIIERECYNKAKSESAKMLICPPDKEKAIEDALRFFGMIA